MVVDAGEFIQDVFVWGHVMMGSNRIDGYLIQGETSRVG